MRAKRQRTVLAAVMDVCKKSDPATLNKILNAALPNVSTSLDVDEMTAMLSNVTKYNITGSDGFPFESNRATGTVGSKGSCVIPVNLEQNVSLLHDFLFDDAAYQVSAQVKQYSNKVSSDTGR
jgi:anionic cell wall polymer biosynthesis LytR-Cps2A-Psr (LCP) family protein